MAGIGSVVKEVKDSVSNFTNAFTGQERARSYPHIEDETSKITGKNWLKSLGYSFRIINKYTHAQVPKLTSSDDKSDFTEFKLQINPQDLTQDENFSVNIVPTQKGKVIEHQGIVFRDLVIAGTTGIHPFRRGGGVTRDGVIVFGPDKQSGYEEFLELRNYFRAYAARKKDPEFKNYAMQFINWKDNEWFLVEPTKFSLKRSSSRPMLYDYAITLKILDFSKKPEREKDIFLSFDETINSALDKIDTANKVLLRSQELITKIEKQVTDSLLEPLRKVNNVLKNFTGTVFSLIDLPFNVVTRVTSDAIKIWYEQVENWKNFDIPSRVVNNFLKSYDKISANINRYAENTGIDGLQKVLPPEIQAELTLDPVSESVKEDFRKDLENTANEVTRQFLEDFKDDVRRIKDNFIEHVGLGDTDYNDYIGRESTYTPDVRKEPTFEEMEVLTAFENVEIGLNQIMSSNDFFTSSLEEKVKNVNDLFNNTLNLPVPTSAKEIIIQQDDSLEDIASRELGTAERWSEIAVLNNLKPPYISDTSDTRVKVYGDKILIPTASGAKISNVIDQKEYLINQSLTELEKQLGVDIKLTTEFDLFVTNVGDIDLIAGGSNAGQAVIIKLHLEKGSLKYHPTIGVNLDIGTKLLDINKLSERITESILQDSRFETITNLSARVENSTVFINLSLKVKDMQTSIPLTLAL